MEKSIDVERQKIQRKLFKILRTQVVLRELSAHGVTKSEVKQLIYGDRESTNAVERWYKEESTMNDSALNVFFKNYDYLKKLTFFEYPYQFLLTNSSIPITKLEAALSDHVDQISGTVTWSSETEYHEEEEYSGLIFSSYINQIDRIIQRFHITSLFQLSALVHMARKRNKQQELDVYIEALLICLPCVYYDTELSTRQCAEHWVQLASNFCLMMGGNPEMIRRYLREMSRMKVSFKAYRQSQYLFNFVHPIVSRTQLDDFLYGNSLPLTKRSDAIFYCLNLRNMHSEEEGLWIRRSYKKYKQLTRLSGY